MRLSMQRGDRIELRGFGVFQVKPRKRGIGRNPRTGKEVRIRWWDDAATTYRDLALMPDEARERLPDLPQEVIDRRGSGIAAALSRAVPAATTSTVSAPVLPLPPCRATAL